MVVREEREEEAAATGLCGGRLGHEIGRFLREGACKAQEKQNDTAVGGRVIRGGGRSSTLGRLGNT